MSLKVYIYFAVNPFSLCFYYAVKFILLKLTMLIILLIMVIDQEMMGYHAFVSRERMWSKLYNKQRFVL